MSESILLLGNCLDSLKELPDNSVDAVVTDPPYGLKFMGKKWDYEVPSVEIWREVLRVLKPGGHLLSFGGTRTYHRMVCAIEDAGFEIRDQIQWLYGSGFPKSHSIDKAIDKLHGAEREVVGVAGRSGSIRNAMAGDFAGGEYMSTTPATEDAIKWQGWGTALKPANEPIVLARKPLEPGHTIAENVLKYGVGGLNIDESRVGTTVETWPASRSYQRKEPGENNKGVQSTGPIPQGRWPANIILDEVAAEMLDEQSGILKQGVAGNKSRPFGDGEIFGTAKEFKPNNSTTYACDTPSGASRFFYVAKASKRERNAGLEGMPETAKPLMGEFKTNPGRSTPKSSPAPRANHHPTVKPVKLMEYLIKLITPPGGIVLDPFMGSGTTGVAAKNLGFDFIGCEMSPEYLEIAEKRINKKVS